MLVNLVKNIKLNLIITRKNIKIIIYDLNFGVIYNFIFFKKIELFNKYKLYLIESLLESGILKVKLKK